MIIVLNGPLGIGKSTLADALTESIDACAWLSGDHLAAVNPPSKSELEHLHSAIELLVQHHRRFGYRNFVIEHIWRTESELADLKHRLADPEVHCFLLTLPVEENLRRIEAGRRHVQSTSASLNFSPYPKSGGRSKGLGSERHSMSQRLRQNSCCACWS